MGRQGLPGAGIASVASWESRDYSQPWPIGRFAGAISFGKAILSLFRYASSGPSALRGAFPILSFGLRTLNP
jgi:hypothetical protein